MDKKMNTKQKRISDMKFFLFSSMILKALLVIVFELIVAIEFLKFGMYSYSNLIVLGICVLITASVYKDAVQYEEMRIKYG